MDEKKSTIADLYHKFILDPSDYETLENISDSQSYEQIFTAKDKKTKKIIDIHQFEESDSSYDVNQIFLHELEFYIKVRSYVGIPKFYGYFFSSVLYKSIVTEHIPNLNLTQFYIKLKNQYQRYVSIWNDTFKAKLTFGIACTMMHFHSFNAIHKHLRSNIIFFDENFYPKITDFSLTKIQIAKSYKTGVRTISHIYDSPEINSDDQITQKSDVYSFGVILLSIVQGDEKFKYINGTNNLFIPEDAPTFISNIIKQCLNPNPKKRPTSAKIVSTLIKYPKLFPETNKEEYYNFVSIYMQNVEISKENKNLFIMFDKDKQEEKEKNDDNKESNYKDELKQLKEEKNDDDKESKYKDEIEQLKEENKLLRARIAELESIKNVKDENRTSLELLKQEMIDDHTIIEKIGNGVQSEVFKVSKTNYFALKVINVLSSGSEQFNQLKRLLHDYEILNLLNHRNIIKTFGFCLGNSMKSPSILLEYCKANLETVVESLNDVQRVCVIYEIAAGMEVVHSAKIIHRNLKPTNILIGVDDHVKVSDFGVSCLFSTEDQINSMTVDFSSIKFMAPELVNECSRYDNKVDVYAFGIIVFFILTGGKMPKNSISDVGIGKKAKIPTSVNKIAQKLINWCWEKKPEERPSFSQILEFIKNKNFMIIDDVEDEIDQIKSFLAL